MTARCAADVSPKWFWKQGAANIEVVNGRVFVESWVFSRPTRTPDGYVEEYGLGVSAEVLGGAVSRCFDRYFPEVPRGYADPILDLKYRELGVRTWNGYLDLDPVVVSVGIAPFTGVVYVKPWQRQRNLLVGHAAVGRVELGVWPVSLVAVGEAVRSVWVELGVVDRVGVSEGDAVGALVGCSVRVRGRVVPVFGSGSLGVVLGMLEGLDPGDVVEFVAGLLAAAEFVAGGGDGSGEVGAVLVGVLGVVREREATLVERVADLVASRESFLVELEREARIELDLEPAPLDRVGYVVPVEVADLMAGHPYEESLNVSIADTRVAVVGVAGLVGWLGGVGLSGWVGWCEGLVEAARRDGVGPGGDPLVSADVLVNDRVGSEVLGLLSVTLISPPMT